MADAAAMRQRLLDEPELIGSTIYNEDGTIVWRGDDAPPEAVPLTYRGEGYNAEFVNNGLPSNMVPIGEYVKSFDKNAKVYATKYSNAEVLKNPALAGRTKSVTVELSNGKKVTYPARAEWEPASRVKYEAVIINDRAYIEKSILDKDLGIGQKVTGIQDSGAGFVKKEEGFYANPYQGAYDDWGTITIGYGHVINFYRKELMDVAGFTQAQIDDMLNSNNYSRAAWEASPKRNSYYRAYSITETQATKLFEIRIPKYTNELNKFLNDNNIKLNQNQYDAVSSFMFQWGQNSFLTSSGRNYRETMANFLKKGDFSEEATRAAFLTYDGGGAYSNRRNREIKLFLEGVYER